MRAVREVVSFIPAVLVLAIGVSCSPAPTYLPGSAKAVEEARVQQQTVANALSTMEAEGVIAVETDQMAQSVSFFLTLKKPDTVFIRLEGPFGLGIGAALVTPNRFQFYNSLTNELISGDANTENLSRVLNMQLSFDDIVGLFAGARFMPDDDRDPDNIRTDGETLFAEYDGNGEKRVYWIENESKNVRRIQFFRGGDKPALELRYSDYKEIGGLRIPYKIRMIRSSARQTAGISYREIALNKDLPPVIMTVPDNADRVELK